MIGRVIGFAVLVACSSKQGTTSTGSGGGTGSAPVAADCELARKKVAELYRAEAIANKEAGARIEESVADNTAMVMNDCVKAPSKVSACIQAVATAGDLEHRCLVQLDDEGSEGEALRQ
jgi:hypothetical protein